MNHDVSFSKDLNYFTDTYSTVDTPPFTVVRSSVDGKVMVELEKTDISSTYWKKDGLHPNRL